MLKLSESTENSQIYPIDDPQIIRLVVHATTERNLSSASFNVQVEGILSESFDIQKMDAESNEFQLWNEAERVLNKAFSAFCNTMADCVTKDSTIIIGKENTLTQSFIKCMAFRVQILPEDFENFGKYMFENLSKTIANSQ
jgi:hypothetical protein